MSTKAAEVIGYGGYTITGPEGAAGVFTALLDDGTRIEMPMPSIEHIRVARAKITELESNIIESAEHLRDLGIE